MNLEMYLADEARKAAASGEIHKWQEAVSDAFASGQMKPQELTIGGLFEEIVPNGRRLRKDRESNLYEGGAMSLANFQYVTDNVIRTLVMEGYEDGNFIGDRLVDTVPSKLIHEEIPDVGGYGDEVQKVGPNGEYVQLGVNEALIRLPSTEERGALVEINRDILFFDRTGLIYTRASNIGQSLRINKENRILDTVLGVDNGFVRNGQAYNTYLTSGAWVNVKTSNALANWESIEAVELLFDDMTHLISGDILDIMPNQLIVPTALRNTAKSIVSATEVRSHTDSASRTAIYKNPIDNYEILSTNRVKARSSSATSWWIGDFKKAFVYVENWPITVTNLRPGTYAEFKHGTVAGFRVDERGVVGIRAPQFVAKSTA